MGGGRGGLPDTKRGGGQSTSGPIYEKLGGGGGGGGGQFASGPLRKVGGGGGGAFCFRSITKSGGGGGGRAMLAPPLGSGSKSQKLRKPGPAPHKRTLTLLGEGFVRTPRAPPGYGLDV